MLWVKYLKPVLAGKRDCVVTAFGARIGSIEDNQRGGWYSYRASKAALNMLLKTASLEYVRIAKGVRFLIFHPGTTDTPLSKPFQRFVSEDQLFTPEFVAERVVGLVGNEVADKSIQFLDWDGEPIPW
jgi:NAD(P)-dependent dehydrogenase (short-subunit alcohol dehydrogenase family)